MAFKGGAGLAEVDGTAGPAGTGAEVGGTRTTWSAKTWPGDSLWNAAGAKEVGIALIRQPDRVTASRAPAEAT